MADLGELVVRIKADAAQLEREMKKANGVVQQSAKGMKSELSGLGVAIRGYLGTQALRSVIQLSDSWTMLQGKLKMVTAGTADLAQTSERLFKIAQDTRTDLGATATLYQRVALAANRLGIEQEQIFLFTEQLNKQLVLGGLSSAEAASGILQLTQAISKGVLNGDEFRTVLETMPLVMEALERQTGKTRGELLQMSQDGKLTADLIVNAINGMADKTNKRFSDMPRTFDQALQQLENSFTKFLGENSLITSYVANLGNGLEAIAKIMDKIGKGAGPAMADARLTVLMKERENLQRGVDKFGTGNQGILSRMFDSPEDVANAQAKLADLDKRILAAQYQKIAAGGEIYGPNPREIKPGGAGGGGGGGGSGKSQARQTAEDYDKARDALAEFLDKQAEELELAGLTGRALAIRREELEAKNAAMRDGNLLTAEETELVKSNAAARYDLDEATKQIAKSQEEAAETAREWRKELTDGLTDAILHFDNARDAAKRFFDEIASQILKKHVTGPLSDGIMGGIEKSGLFSGLGNLFGGFFADGGNPPVGKASIVGERGPEIFVPRTAGTILPNGQGMGGVNVYQTINVAPGVPELINSKIREAAPVIASMGRDMVFDARLRGGSGSKLLGARS